MRRVLLRGFRREASGADDDTVVGSLAIRILRLVRFLALRRRRPSLFLFSRDLLLVGDQSQFKDPIPRLVVVERSFFEPNREIVVLVVVLVVSASEVIVRSRRRKTGDDDDDDDDVVGCVFDIICKIIIVSIISRRPLLFVAEERKKNAIFTPFLFFVLSFSLSLSLSRSNKGKSVDDVNDDDDDDGVFSFIMAESRR